MDKIKVLLAEDELALAHIVRESLEERKFDVILCADGNSALKQYDIHKPDILVLDVMMPHTDGFAVAKKIREKDSITPIIFLTARSQAKDVINGFELGANDYLKKPFSIEELIVRINVQLGNKKVQIDPPDKNTIFQLGQYAFDSKRNLLIRGLKISKLSSRESDVLKMLCEMKQALVERDNILKKIWGDDSFFNARSLDVFITKLRKQLADDPSVQIINVRGSGYKLVY